jgi:hypothetical protein
MLVQLTTACFLAAANAYTLPPAVLYGILRVEGGRVGMATQNNDQRRSQDLGPFQINTVWLRTFTIYWRLPDQQTTYRILRDDGCANALAAAAILRYHLLATNDLETAVGRYHAGPAGSAAEAARYLRSYRYVLRYGRLPPRG